MFSKDGKLTEEKDGSMEAVCRKKCIKLLLKMQNGKFFGKRFFGESTQKCGIKQHFLIYAKYGKHNFVIKM